MDEPPRAESWVERTIRLAVERGEFDGLPGAGEPLGIIDEPYDPLWWAKRLVRSEGITAEELRTRRTRDS